MHMVNAYNGISGNECGFEATKERRDVCLHNTFVAKVKFTSLGSGLNEEGSVKFPFFKTANKGGKRVQILQSKKKCDSYAWMDGLTGPESLFRQSLFLT